MGLFEAEVRGHTGEEDILTSSVFGTLEILDRRKFLELILEQCRIQLSTEAVLESFTFNYWKGMGKRTPDVILEDKLNLIFFENKLNAPLDVHQLVDEYKDGIKAHKNFWLMAVTSDWIEPSEVQKSKELLTKNGIKYPNVQWINWQRIYAILYSNAKNGNQTEEKLIGNLLSLLEAKGLSAFIGFVEAQLISLAALWPEVIDFLHKCSALLGSLSGRLNEKGITCIEKGFTQETVLTGTRSRMVLQDFGRWLPGGIAMRAWDNEWKEKDPRQGFLLRLDPSTLEVGYRLGFGKNVKFLQMFAEASQSCHLAEKLHAVDTCVVSYYGVGYKLLNRVTGDNLNKEAFSLEALGNARFLIIGRVFNQEEMASPKLLDEIEECLVQIRDIVNENGLYFSGEAIGEGMKELPMESQLGEQEPAEE